MSDILDDKLREILQNYLRDWVENDGRPKHLLNDVEDILPEIKQAFIDEGYVTPENAKKAAGLDD